LQLSLLLFSSNAGLHISWEKLTASYSLLTAAGGSLGYLLGIVFARDKLAVNAGMPIVVILMVVGVINPGGVDPNRPAAPAVQFLKKVSPFASAIDAMMIAEFKDLEFKSSSGWFSRFGGLPRLGAMVRERKHLFLRYILLLFTPCLLANYEFPPRLE
jgi:hypothetical protein